MCFSLFLSVRTTHYIMQSCHDSQYHTSHQSCLWRAHWIEPKSALDVDMICPVCHAQVMCLSIPLYPHAGRRLPKTIGVVDVWWALCAPRPLICSAVNALRRNVVWTVQTWCEHYGRHPMCVTNCISAIRILPLAAFGRWTDRHGLRGVCVGCGDESTTESLGLNCEQYAKVLVADRERWVVWYHADLAQDARGVISRFLLRLAFRDVERSWSRSNVTMC